MTEEIPTFKITLVGEAGVGKTCILSRFVINEFDQNEVSTFNPTYNSKELEYEDLDNAAIRFDIWDTTGQEKYRSLSKIFYRDSRATIMVYDSTDRKSFEEIKNYWYSQIKQNSIDNVVLAIAANKSDLYEKEEVKPNEGKEFAKEIGAIFKIVSALSGAGIVDLFKFIGYKLLDPNFDIYNENVKITEENIIQVRNTLKDYNDIKKERDTINLNKKDEKNEKQKSKKCC